MCQVSARLAASLWGKEFSNHLYIASVYGSGLNTAIFPFPPFVLCVFFLFACVVPTRKVAFFFSAKNQV